MAWIDSYRPASFRGVPFFVESHDSEHGRRQVIHEFAQRDTPYTEDLGRSARTYSIEAYLVGDDYPAQRDRLIAAAEAGGVGELVHPYYGNLQVKCGSIKVRESSDELRMCRVQLSFAESGQLEYPAAAEDPVRAVAGAANGMLSAAAKGFAGRFTVAGVSSFVASAGALQVGGLSSILQSLPINAAQTQLQGVAEFFQRARSLADTAVSLLSVPATLAGEVTGLISSVRDVFGVRGWDALTTIRDAFTAPYTGPLDTPNRRQLQVNTDSLSALVRQAAVGELARFAVLQTQPAELVSDLVESFRTRDEAVAARDVLTAAIDAEMEDPVTGEDEFVALTDLLAAVVRNVPGPDLQLPRLATVTPPATLPSLVLAYRLYGDAGRDTEIADLNRIRHPGFVPGGRPLQVVTDA